MFRDSACQETVTSHVPRFRICFLAGSASHVYCSTELSRFRVDKKPRWYCSMQHTWAMLQLWLSMYFCYFMLFASKMSPYICDFCLQHRCLSIFSTGKGFLCFCLQELPKKAQEMPGQPSKILKTSVRSPSKYVAHFVLLKCVDIAI